MIAMILTAACFIVAIADLAPPDKYEYEHIIEPVVAVHVVDDLTQICGKAVDGCASGNDKTCDIYIGERSSPNTLQHERRHCHGWDHVEDVAFAPWYPVQKILAED